MLDQYLQLTAGGTLAEAAVSLGVHESYVSKLRRGWRPDRVREDLFQRLVAFISKGSRDAARVREEGAGYRGQSREYLRGRQDVLSEIIRWAVDQQATIGPLLGGDKPPIPSVEEAEAADEVLRRELDLRKPQPRAKKPA